MIETLPEITKLEIVDASYKQPILVTMSRPLLSPSRVEASAESAEPLFDARCSDATVSYDEAGPTSAPGREARQRLNFDAGVRCPPVVSESFARRAFGGRDPIGRRIRYSGSDQRPWDVIVGVVGDVKEAGLGAEKMNAFYSTLEQAQWVDNPLWLAVRGRGDAAALTATIKRAIWSIDKDQPISRIASMSARIAATDAQRHFALMVFEAFALASLALAAIGIYGVLSGSVAERIREIGVRSALGASPADIYGLILRQGMKLTGIGIVLGVGGAILASRALVTLLFGVSTLDVVTYAGVIALLWGIAAIACWLPASRAAHIDPSITLRAD